MAPSNSATPKTGTAPMTPGDAAVTGLLNGLFAGLIMALYLVVAGLLRDLGPVDLLNHLAGGIFNSLAGIAIHLAISAVYGVVFGLIWWSLHRRVPAIPGWLIGLIFGLVLLLVAQVAAAAFDPLLWASGPLHLAVAHLVYGLLLGLLAGRNIPPA